MIRRLLKELSPLLRHSPQCLWHVGHRCDCGIESRAAALLTPPVDVTPTPADVKHVISEGELEALGKLADKFSDPDNPACVLAAQMNHVIGHLRQWQPKPAADPSASCGG